MSDSDGDAGSSALPASASATSTVPRTPHKQPRRSQADPLPVADMSLTEDSNYIPEIYNSSTLPDHLDLPDLEDAVEATSNDKVGGSLRSNFEGFTCLNGLSQLPIDSDVSEVESLLTPAQRTAGTKSSANLGNLVEPIWESELAASSSFGKVIIIEPVAGAHPVDKFFSNDLTLSKALANSPFGRAGIAGFSKNLGQKILVVTFERELCTEVASLLRINQLASWNIKCRLPVSFVRSVGVIGPLGEDVLNEDLVEALVLAGHSNATAERILKGKDKLNTSMFKITFNTSTLPAFLHLGYQRFQVSPYIAKPWQCFKCQRFNHSAISCKNAPRCVACSGAHNVKDCLAQGSPLCCNCGGKHTANYGGCKLMKEAQAVEKTRVEQRVSYRDALRMVKQPSQKDVCHPNNGTSSGKSFSQSPLPSAPTAELRTWAQKVKPTHPQAANTVTTGTQTDNPATSTLQGLTVIKFIELMSKIIALCTKTDNLDTVKIVTELTRETLLLDGPLPASIANPICPDPAPYQVPSNKTSNIPVSQPNSAGPPGATNAEMTEDLIEPSPVIGKNNRKTAQNAAMMEDLIKPSPIIGKNVRKTAQGSSKLGRYQMVSQVKNKPKSVFPLQPENKDKVNTYTKCLPIKK